MAWSIKPTTRRQHHLPGRSPHLHRSGRRQRRHHRLRGIRDRQPARLRPPSQRDHLQLEHGFERRLLLHLSARQHRTSSRPSVRQAIRSTSGSTNPQPLVTYRLSTPTASRSPASASSTTPPLRRPSRPPRVPSFPASPARPPSPPSASPAPAIRRRSARSATSATASRSPPTASRSTPRATAARSSTWPAPGSQYVVPYDFTLKQQGAPIKLQLRSQLHGHEPGRNGHLLRQPAGPDDPVHLRQHGLRRQSDHPRASSSPSRPMAPPSSSPIPRARPSRLSVTVPSHQLRQRRRHQRRLVRRTARPSTSPPARPHRQHLTSCSRTRPSTTGRSRPRTPSIPGRHGHRSSHRRLLCRGRDRRPQLLPDDDHRHPRLQRQSADHGQRVSTRWSTP